MAHTNEGGPAFPIIMFDKYGPASHIDGLSVRDYFAGQFLTSVQIHGEGVEASVVARACYLMADAMLAERERAK